MVLTLAWGKLDNMGLKQNATFDEQAQRERQRIWLKLQHYTTDTDSQELNKQVNFPAVYANSAFILHCSLLGFGTLQLCK